VKACEEYCTLTVSCSLIYMTSLIWTSVNIFISPAGAVAKYCNEYVFVCVCVCLSVRISQKPNAQSLPNFLCMLSMAVALSSFGVTYA